MNQSQKGWADDYVPVNVRIAQFIAKYPEGSLQPVDPANPYTVIEGKGESSWIVYGAAAYRSPDDTRPGIGYAWEPVPGKTPYTRGSELMVAETSAWGRAIAALGIATNRSVASADEVRSAQERSGRSQSAASTTPGTEASPGRSAPQRAAQSVSEEVPF
jgi:hypothetical protein